MKKTLIKSIFIILSLFASALAVDTRASKTWAKELEMSQSATKEEPIINGQQDNNDKKKIKIVNFLKSYESPFINEIDEIITVSEKCGLKPELMIAISGVESTFGQNYPLWSNNPLGWGIYGNQILGFPSFGKAFETAACGISEKYPKDIQNNLEKLGNIYNGVTPLAWSSKVRFFINKIENTPLNTISLPVNL